MNYKPIFKPVVNGTPVESTWQDGVFLQQQEAGEIVLSQVVLVKSFVSNVTAQLANAEVAVGAISMTVQPSANQLEGLLTYMNMINASENTSAVETALGI